MKRIISVFLLITIWGAMIQFGPVSAENNLQCKISMSSFYHALITPEGSLWNWSHCYGPFKKMKLDNVIDVSVRFGNDNDVCYAAVTSDGALWFYNITDDENSQFYRYYNHYDDTYYAEISTGIDIAQACLGKYYNAAITKHGALLIWEDDDIKPAGSGFFLDTWVELMEDVKNVDLGNEHGAALKEDGSLWMWGNNECGQLGNGTNVDSNTPIKVMDDVKEITLGDYHSVAIKEDGSLWTWGLNGCGQLGNGTTIESNIPVKVMDDVEAVAAGELHSMALKTDGSLWTWGWNALGQLGNGTTVDSSTPIKVMDGVIAIASGGNYSSAIKENRSLWTWGLHAGAYDTGQEATPRKLLDDVRDPGNGVSQSKPSENTDISTPEQSEEISQCVISDEYISLSKTGEGEFNCNFIFNCEGIAKNLCIHFETDDCIDWDMSQHPIDFAYMDYNGDVLKEELSPGRYDSNLKMYCNNLTQGLQCNNSHKVKMIISGDNFETVEAEDNVLLNYVKRVSQEEFMLSKLKLAGLSRKITNEIFTKQTMYDSKLDEIKKYIKAQVHNKDTSVPDEIYEAFANAILNKITDDSIDIKELDTDMNEMTKQIYKQLKTGISGIDEDVVIDGQTYNVNGLICAVSWGKLVGVSWANVDYKGRTINLMWNSSGWTPKEFAENSNNAIAAFGGVVAQLNSELWKDFMAYYVVDGAQLIGVNIRKENADKVIDITEKVIRAVCGDKEDAKNLVDSLGDTAKDVLKNTIFKGNGVKAFIKSNYHNGETIIKRAEEYLKLKKAFDDFEERFRFSGASDELLRDYENIKKLLTELERGINQDFTLGSNGRVYFTSNNIKVSNSIGNTLFEMKDGNVLTSICEFEPCYEGIFEDGMDFYGSIDTGTSQFTIETSDNSVAIIGNGTINTIETDGNIIVNANQSEKQYGIEAIDNNSLIKILTQNNSEDEYFSKVVTGSLDSNDILNISYDENEPVITADTDNLFDVIIRTDEGENRKANVQLESLDKNNEEKNDSSSQMQPSSKFQCSDWAQSEVEEAYEKGLITESLTDEDLTQTISRAEFADLAVTLYEKMSGKTAQVGGNPFDDISSHPLKNGILKAYNLGITKGTSADLFSPYSNINREQLVTMLSRAVKKAKINEWDIEKDFLYLLDTDNSSKFSDDAYISDYANNPVYYMANNGIVKGVDSSHFAPLDTATREQAILISLRCFQNIYAGQLNMLNWGSCIINRSNAILIYEENSDNIYDKNGKLLVYRDYPDILPVAEEVDLNEVGFFYENGEPYFTDAESFNHVKDYSTIYVKLTNGEIIEILYNDLSVDYTPYFSFNFGNSDFYDINGRYLTYDNKKGLLYHDGTVCVSIENIKKNDELLKWLDYYGAAFYEENVGNKVLRFYKDGDVTDEDGDYVIWVEGKGFCYQDGTVYITEREFKQIYDFEYSEEFVETDNDSESEATRFEYYDDLKQVDEADYLIESLINEKVDVETAENSADTVNMVGTVENVDANYMCITLGESDGSTQLVFVDKNATIFDSATQTERTLSSVKVGDTITAVITSNGFAQVATSIVIHVK